MTVLYRSVCKNSVNAKLFLKHNGLKLLVNAKANDVVESNAIVLEMFSRLMQALMEDRQLVLHIMEIDVINFMKERCSFEEEKAAVSESDSALKGSMPLSEFVAHFSMYQQTSAMFMSVVGDVCNVVTKEELISKQHRNAN